MRYDFDMIVDRRGTGSEKWEYIQPMDDDSRLVQTDAYYGDDPVLPLWVADMDFQCAEPIRKALAEHVTHGIFGYTLSDDMYKDAVIGWMKRRHDFEVQPEWIVCTHGIVPALHLLVQTFAQPGHKVLVQRPVYYPFFSAAENNECEVVSSSLICENGDYRMDYEDLERKASDPDVTLAILCSPHNPVGRVWTEEELRKFGEICRDNGVQVVVDEIHHDLVMPGNKHVCYGTLAGLAEHAIICTAPSKTFNMAGLQTSNLIIQDEKLRAAFEQTMESCGVFGVGSFGRVACMAAYNEGDEWLDQLLEYISGNLEMLMDFFAAELPEIPVIRPQGTYLVWFDCRSLGLDHMELRKLMLGEAKVFLDEGYIFGEEGKGYERINLACPRALLKQALERIRDAIRSLES